MVGLHSNQEMEHFFSLAGYVNIVLGCWLFKCRVTFFYFPYQYSNEKYINVPKSYQRFIHVYVKKPVSKNLHNTHHLELIWNLNQIFFLLKLKSATHSVEEQKSVI